MPVTRLQVVHFNPKIPSSRSTNPSFRPFTDSRKTLPKFLKAPTAAMKLKRLKSLNAFSASVVEHLIDNLLAKAARR